MSLFMVGSHLLVTLEYLYDDGSVMYSCTNQQCLIDQSVNMMCYDYIPLHFRDIPRIPDSTHAPQDSSKLYGVFHGILYFGLYVVNAVLKIVS